MPPLKRGKYAFLFLKVHCVGYWFHNVEPKRESMCNEKSSLALCKEVSFSVWTTKVETRKPSSPAPAEVGIEISSRSYWAVSQMPASHSTDSGKQSWRRLGPTWYAIPLSKLKSTSLDRAKKRMGSHFCCILPGCPWHLPLSKKLFFKIYQIWGSLFKVCLPFTFSRKTIFPKNEKSIWESKWSADV